MTADAFRKLALSMPGAAEGSHMGNADFRAGGPKPRIFATIWEDEEFGMVKLTPEQQGEFVADVSGAFEPVKGKCGEMGCTRVRLAAAGRGVVKRAMVAAWGNVTGKDDLGPKVRSSAIAKKRPK